MTPLAKTERSNLAKAAEMLDAKEAELAALRAVAVAAEQWSQAIVWEEDREKRRQLRHALENALTDWRAICPQPIDAPEPSHAG